MKKLMLFVFIFVTLTTTVFGQAKEITADELRQSFRPAYDKLFEISYRKRSTEENYKDGKLSGKIEIISEFIPPKKRHTITVEMVGDKRQKSEMFIIEGIYYCRKDDGEWTKSQKGCGSGGGFSVLPDAVSSKFTLEETKLDNVTAKLYQQYMTYVFPEDKISYFLDKFWINDEGFLLRREMEYGWVEPKFIRSKQSDVYEYNPKDLKIEAPIK
ncbi:hypothetical protein BH20ACI4_BH20ACI4_01170 [soil metagenome]